MNVCCNYKSAATISPSDAVLFQSAKLRPNRAARHCTHDDVSALSLSLAERAARPEVRFERNAGRRTRLECRVGVLVGILAFVDDGGASRQR